MVNGVKYDSIKKASSVLGISSTTILQRLRSSNSNESWTRVKPRKVWHTNGVKIKVYHMIYNSVMEAASALEISTTTLSRHVNNPKKPEYTRLINNTVKRKLGRAVQVNSVVYDSINQAARVLGLNTAEITSRLNSSKEPNYTFLEPGKKPNQPILRVYALTASVTLAFLKLQRR